MPTVAKPDEIADALNAPTLDNKTMPLREGNGQVQAGTSNDDDDELQLEENVIDAEPLLEGNDDDDLALEDNVDKAPPPAPPTLSPSEHKAAGNLAFKEGRLAEARSAYGAALAATGAADNGERSTLLANRAACALKLADWGGAINDCTAALSMSAITPATRTKAIFRRATAFVEAGDADGARHDLQQLPASDPMVRKLRARVDSLGKPVPAAAAATATTAGSEGSSAAVRARVHHRRVSCISPTTPERHLFHETALYRCFREQTHPDLELIVVDTGATPSPFFSTLR